MINIALWSLFFEFIAYILFGFLLFRLNKLLLSFIAIIGFFGVCYWFNDSFGYNGSAHSVTIIEGFSRVAFSFTVGIVLFRSRSLITKLGKIIPVYTLVLLPMLFMLPRNIMPWYAYLLLAIIVLPVSLIVGVNTKLDGLIGKNIINFLGEISYPVYAIHIPLMWMMGKAVKKTTGITELNQLVWFGLIILPVSIGLSYLALKMYDKPLRKYLKLKFSSYLDSR